MNPVVKNALKLVLPPPVRKSLLRAVHRIRNGPPPLKVNPRERAERLLKAVLSSQGLMEAGATPDVFLQPLHKEFRLLGTDSSRIPDSWLAGIVRADGNSLDQWTALLEASRSFDPASLHATQWLGIYGLLSRTALFEVGYQIRSAARQAALAEYERTGALQACRLAVAAALECQDWSSAEHLLAQLPDSSVGHIELSTFGRALLALYGGKHWPTDDEMAPGDADYGWYITGRSVAVVGPAQTNERNAEEIDSYDRVVRLNYRESGKSCDPIVKGLRCDVTYFNSHQALSLIESGVRMPAEVEWAVFKGPVREEQYRAGAPDAATKTRCFHTVNQHMFNGTLNAVPNVVLDLLRFRPRELKVFHADLMLTAQRYVGYYPPGSGLEDDLIEVFRKSCVTHDPMTQYELLSNLHGVGAISGDARFTEVMRLGAEGYMRQLQDAYGEGPALVSCRSD